MTDCCEYCGQEDRYGHNAICVMNEIIDLRAEIEKLRAVLTFIVSQQDHSLVSPVALLAQCIDHARATLLPKQREDAKP